jgi:hypothetical protein
LVLVVVVVVVVVVVGRQPRGTTLAHSLRPPPAGPRLRRVAWHRRNEGILLVAGIPLIDDIPVVTKVDDFDVVGHLHGSLQHPPPTTRTRQHMTSMATTFPSLLSNKRPGPRDNGSGPAVR